MVANNASGGGARSAMMAGKVASNATDYGAFDTSFRLGGRGSANDCRHNDGAPKQLLHERNSL